MILDGPLLFIFLTLIACFPLFSNPLSIGLTLLFCVIVISILVGLLRRRMWVSYTLILVLVGGLLVVFIYVALLASNELFETISITQRGLVIACVLAFFSVCYKALFLEVITESSNHLEFLVWGETAIQWLNAFYSFELGSLTLFLAFYLLFTLIAVVTVSKNISLSLRTRL